MHLDHFKVQFQGGTKHDLHSGGDSGACTGAFGVFTHQQFGHLALLQYFFGINADNVLPFAVLLHFGTLVSVFIVYWKDIVDLIKELGAVIKDIFTGKGLRINANPTRRLGFMIIVATIPTAVIGLLFNDLFNAMYLSLAAIGIGLLITGTILVIAERMGTSNKTVKEMKFRHAVFVGLMQGVAICPGSFPDRDRLFSEV